MLHGLMCCITSCLGLGVILRWFWWTGKRRNRSSLEKNKMKTKKGISKMFYLISMYTLLLPYLFKQRYCFHPHLFTKTRSFGLLNLKGTLHWRLFSFVSFFLRFLSIIKYGGLVKVGSECWWDLISYVEQQSRAWGHCDSINHSSRTMLLFVQNLFFSYFTLAWGYRCWDELLIESLNSTKFYKVSFCLLTVLKIWVP